MANFQRFTNCVQHSCVTTAPQPTGKGGDYDFPEFSMPSARLQMTGAL